MHYFSSNNSKNTNQRHISYILIFQKLSEYQWEKLYFWHTILLLCFFLTLITVFHIFSAIYSYLSLLFSHFVFLFSPSFSFSSRHETHSTIYSVWFDFSTIIVYCQKKKCRVNYNQPNALIFLWNKLWVFPSSLWNYFLFSFWSGWRSKKIFLAHAVTLHCNEHS